MIYNYIVLATATFPLQVFGFQSRADKIGQFYYIRVPGYYGRRTLKRASCEFEFAFLHVSTTEQQVAGKILVIQPDTFLERTYC